MFLCFKDFHFTHLVSGYRNSCHENPHRSQDSAELFDGTLRVAFALHRSKAASSLTLRVPTDCPQKGLVSVVNLLGEMGDVMYIYIYSYKGVRCLLYHNQSYYIYRWYHAVYCCSSFFGTFIYYIL